MPYTFCIGPHGPRSCVRTTPDPRRMSFPWLIAICADAGSGRLERDRHPLRRRHVQRSHLSDVLYTAPTDDAVIADQGRLWAFRVTATQSGDVSATDPFNGANDYGDMTKDDVWSGEFIRVPDAVADGGQDGLEAWSNENNVFQFIASRTSLPTITTRGSSTSPTPARLGRLPTPSGPR